MLCCMVYYTCLTVTESYTNSLDKIRPNEKFIHSVFKYASKTDEELEKITGFGNKKKYTYETLVEHERRLLVLYIKKALQKINNKCIEIHNKYNITPFYFTFIEIINVICLTDKDNNSRWIVDIMVGEKTLHVSLRIKVDFIIIVTNPEKDNSFKTCAELTTPAFPIYFMGYPTFDQMIPLPTQVISSGKTGCVLSNKGVQKYPIFKSCIINKVSLENSDLVLGINSTNLSYTGNDSHTSLSFYNYPSKRFLENSPDVELTNEDILTNRDNTETHKLSRMKPVWSDGWIQPALWRNKWPRLLNEPDKEKNIQIANISWDQNGINHKFDNIHTYKWSTQKIENEPLYWRSLTGTNNKEYKNKSMFSIFDNISNIPHGGHK